MSGILSNNLNANNKKIENVPDPLNPQDAVNLRTLTTTINNTVPTNVVTKTNNASATSVLQVSENTNKTIKDFISAGGIIKVSSTGVVTLGVAGVDFLTDSSTNTLTNKTFDANGVGNSITNIETTDFATNVIQTSISSSSTNNEIPTALAVWNALSSVSNLLNRADIDTSVFSTFAIDTSFQLYTIIGNNSCTIELPPLDNITENIYLAFFDGHKNDIFLNSLGDNLIPISAKNTEQNLITTPYTIQSSYCQLIGVAGKGWYIIDYANAYGQMRSYTIDTSSTGPWNIEPLKYQMYRIVAGDPATINLPKLTKKNINIPIYILNQYRNNGTLNAFSGDNILNTEQFTLQTSLSLKGSIITVIGSFDNVYGTYMWHVTDIDWKALLPPGGTTGQFLSKVNNTDYSVQWQTSTGGLDGNTILFGNVAPISSQGVNDNFYLDLVTWNFYQKITGSWVLQGNIKGDDGTNGTNGTNGVGIVSIIRTSGTGAAGTTDTYTITYTNATTSTFNVVNGANGTNGTNGVGVPTGGTAGQILTKIDATNYNTQWVDEAPAASFTSTIKHKVKLGLAISKGQAVYVSSADGTNMIVSKASNTSEATSSKTMGLLETGGVTNAQVNVVAEGLLAGLNTSTAVIGDPVWLGTNGDLIYGLTNKPYAPAHLVFIGVVTRVNSSNGEIFVKVQNGFELREIHDVDLITNIPTNNQLLAYNSTTQLWANKSVTTADIAASTNKNYVTDAQAIVIGNTSGTNTGDNAVNSLYSGLAASKQDTLTLTTTGTSGAATLVSGTLNIPQYSGGGGGGEPAIRKAQPRITRESYY